MTWTLTDIRTFLAVLDAGSISGAAVRADLSKSVVSKRISEFEATLGVPLFTRHAGRITPTDSAWALADRLRPALAELVAAAGLGHPGELKPHHFMCRLSADRVVTYAEQYEMLAPGQLLSDPGRSHRFGEAWRMAQANTFDRIAA